MGIFFRLLPQDKNDRKNETRQTNQYIIENEVQNVF